MDAAGNPGRTGGKRFYLIPPLLFIDEAIRSSDRRDFRF